MRSILILFVVFCLASGSLGPRTSDAAPDALERSLAKLIEHGLKATKGIALGVRMGDAVAKMKGGVTVVYEARAPLGLSGLPGSKGLDGVVRFSGTLESDEEMDEAMASLNLEIVVPAYDRKAMVKKLESIAAKLGLELVVDDTEANVYWVDRKMGKISRDVWIGLGERIIVLEFGEEGRKMPIRSR